jgi:hypothetical protein
MADMQNLAHFEVVLIKDSWKNTEDKNSDSWMPLEEEQELRSWKQEEDKSTARLVEQHL